MKFCAKCGKELLENANACHNCGAIINNIDVISENIVPQKKVSKIVIPVICVLLAITLVVGVLVLGGKPYEKVAKEYINAVLELDIPKIHQTTIFDEEAYDSALLHENKNISSTSEMYSYLSNEYFFWDKETNNYNDFYVAYTAYQQASFNILENKGEIIELESEEMTADELMDAQIEIGDYELSYTTDYPLSEEATIITDKITEGYNVKVVTLIGEQESEYNLKIVNYNGDWFVIDNMCLKVCLGEQFESVPIFKTKISDSVLKKALFTLERKVGPFSISYEKILTKCTKDTKYEFVSYEDGKSEYLSAAEIAWFEENYAEGIENAYFAVVTGKIMHNPEIANYYTENKRILCTILWFNDEEQFTGYTTMNTCSEFGVCASILCTY